MRHNVPDGCIDLVYLDPPFNSKTDYNILFKDGKDTAQVKAFEDKWTFNGTAHDAYAELMDTRISDTMQGLKQFLGDTGTMAYLCVMAIRLLEMHRVLKETGSIYLHCDPTASHYLKIVMDAVFGVKNFRNEIIWRRHVSIHGSFQHAPKQWGRITDTILYYAKSKHATIMPYEQLTEEKRVTKFNLIDDDGRRYYDDSAHIWNSPNMGKRPNLCYEWRGFTNPHPTGWRLSKERLEEEYQKGNIVILSSKKGRRLQRRKYESDFRGTPLGNLWTDINPIIGGEEKLGYPTQKPLALLERIIRASSNRVDS